MNYEITDDRNPNFDEKRLIRKCRIIAFGVGSAAVGSALTMTKTAHPDSIVYMASLCSIGPWSIFTSFPILEIFIDRYKERRKPERSNDKDDPDEGGGWSYGLDDPPPQVPPAPDGFGWIDELEKHANSNIPVGV